MDRNSSIDMDTRLLDYFPDLDENDLKKIHELYPNTHIF